MGDVVLPGETTFRYGWIFTDTCLRLDTRLFFATFQPNLGRKFIFTVKSDDLDGTEGRPERVGGEVRWET